MLFCWTSHQNVFFKFTRNRSSLRCDRFLTTHTLNGFGTDDACELICSGTNAHEWSFQHFKVCWNENVQVLLTMQALTNIHPFNTEWCRLRQKPLWTMMLQKLCLTKSSNTTSEYPKHSMGVTNQRIKHFLHIHTSVIAMSQFKHARFSNQSFYFFSNESEDNFHWVNASNNARIWHCDIFGVSKCVYCTHN